MDMPMTVIGGHKVSRLMCGSNSFFGFSHISAARDAWIRRTFTDELVTEVMVAGAKLGVNCFISGPLDRFVRIREAIEKATGVHTVWFATPGGANLEELKDGIRKTADLGAEFCMPHTCWTEAYLDVANMKIHGYPEAAELIRKLGMVPGLSNHRPESLRVCMKQKYDCETLTLPFNSAGFLCSVETDWTARLIQDCPIPIISIKPLASGRLMPPTGFSFVYQHIKPTDTVAVGVLSAEELEEDVKLALQYTAGAAERVELTTSRSKAALVK